MSQMSRAMRPPSSSYGSTRNVSRSGFRTMSDSSIRTNPSIDDPSNMMSPSSAFSNWLSGTSTFLLTPRMSVNKNVEVPESQFNVLVDAQDVGELEAQEVDLLLLAELEQLALRRAGGLESGG